MNDPDSIDRRDWQDVAEKRADHIAALGRRLTDQRLLVKSQRRRIDLLESEVARLRRAVRRLTAEEQS